LYIMGENPMMSEPNLNRTRHHMQQLEFLVVQDLFINETGAFADVFLPAASWAEKEGTFTNTDRRVQRVRRALSPRGHSRPDWEIICDLAKRIEVRLNSTGQTRWDYSYPSEILAEVAEIVPEYSGITYERIVEVGLQTPVWDKHHQGTPFLFTENFPRGKGKFFPLEFIPAVEQPDDEFPLILTTGRVLEHWHGGTMTRHSNLNDLYPNPYVHISPLDSALFGIEDGQEVKVSSRRGTINLFAYVTEKTPSGVVFIPFHFSEAAANLLTIDALDPSAKIPEYKACSVNVYPIRSDSNNKVSEPIDRGRY